MTRSPRRNRSVLVVAVAASLALGACGTEPKLADGPPNTTVAPDPTDVTTTTVDTDPDRPEEPSAWAPAGAEPAVVLASPGDGGTLTVRVGDRVEIPEHDGPGGIVFDHADADKVGQLLVPYGSSRTFLAVATGELAVQNTIYDPERSCVPPQPVAGFRLVITDGPRPELGDAVVVTPEDEGTTIDLVPGGRIDIDDDLIFSVDKKSDPWVMTGTGQALRPGTVEASISTVPSPDQDEWISVTIRVLDPDRPVRPADTTPATVAETSATAAPPAPDAAATPLRSGPAPAPVVGAPANRACG